MITINRNVDLRALFSSKEKKKKNRTALPRWKDGITNHIRETEATWHKEIGIKRKKEKEKSDGGRFCELELT